MDYSKYKNTKPLPKSGDVAALRTEMDNLPLTKAQRDERMNAFHAERRQMRLAHAAEGMRLRDLFKEDALRECGVAGHPKADELFQLAWDYGHEDGLENVFSYMEEMSDLLK